VCPDPALPFPPSKWRHSSADLAPKKALKTAPASAASAAPRHAGRLASAPDAPKQGAQAVRVAMGRAPQADPSVEATVVPGETADAAAALSPPDVLSVPAPASAEAVAILPVEPPVVADVEMVEVPLPEVADREPASLAEGVPDVSTIGGPGALEEGVQSRSPSWGAATSSPRGAIPMSGARRRSGSGPAAPRNPSSSLTMSGRGSLGMSSVSMPRRRWGRFDRPWRSFPGMFPGSSR
jgi:hypothetical protein